MGDIIDLERTDFIYRCNHVKLGIVWINLIGPPISLTFLIFCILTMFYAKKTKSFLSNIIILIFISEIIQCLSKLIQILKYVYPNLRNDKDFTSGDTPRGIICQIQITFAIFSDLSSLLNTLLLSLRCYDVIKNNERFFDRGNNGILSILFFNIVSLIISILFLFIDRIVTLDNISYRYDVRDRCSYWCWLEHKPSLVCLSLYIVILFLNIFFACKTNSYLKNGYKKLEENQNLSGKTSQINIPLNEKNENYIFRGEKEELRKDEAKENNNLSDEERKMIEKLKLMRIKCLIYPSVSIGYWIFAVAYRIIDDLVMIRFDSGSHPYEKEAEERQLFNDHPFFQFIVQFFLVVFTFFSSIRGIIYGFSFLVFEEKIFFNFFKKCFRRCIKNENSEKHEGEEERKELIRNTNSTSIEEENLRRKSKEEKGDERNSKNIEMNESNNGDKENEKNEI